MIELNVPVGLIASDHVRSSMMGTDIGGNPGAMSNVPGDEAIIFTGDDGGDQIAYLCKTDDDLKAIKEEDFGKPKWFSVSKVHVVAHFSTEDLGQPHAPTPNLDTPEASETGGEGQPAKEETEDGDEETTSEEEGSGDTPPDDIVMTDKEMEDLASEPVTGPEEDESASGKQDA